MSCAINQIFLDDYEPEVAQWCNEQGNCYISEIEAQDGHRRFQIVAVPEPTAEEQQEALVNKYKSMIQAWMDAEAQKLGYDNLLAACTYIDTGVAKFDAEGKGFREWRSAVWSTGYQLIDEVLAGTREIPEKDEDVLTLLPTLNIVYSTEEVTDDADGTAETAE